MAALNAEFIQDPHSLYRRLRAEEPVCEAVMPHGLKVWLVTRYADARDALANPALHKDLRPVQHLFERHRTKAGTGDFAADLTAHLLNSDPPDHTRLRRHVARAFTMRRVELLRPRVEVITEDLLAGLSDDLVDLVEEFAFPLPVKVVCESLASRGRSRSAGCSTVSPTWRWPPKSMSRGGATFPCCAVWRASRFAWAGE